ncbi:hypothetical protein J6590_031002 [Homalodisca vitripennis]|nr:hypothetical protein J6590_031002 [Homalodisca vitripennis]
MSDRCGEIYSLRVPLIRRALIGLPRRVQSAEVGMERGNPCSLLATRNTLHATRYTRSHSVSRIAIDYRDVVFHSHKDWTRLADHALTGLPQLSLIFFHQVGDKNLIHISSLYCIL